MTTIFTQTTRVHASVIPKKKLCARVQKAPQCYNSKINSTLLCEFDCVSLHFVACHRRCIFPFSPGAFLWQQQFFVGNVFPRADVFITPGTNRLQGFSHVHFTRSPTKSAAIICHNHMHIAVQAAAKNKLCTGNRPH